MQVFTETTSSTSFAAFIGSNQYITNSYNHYGYVDDLAIIPSWSEKSAFRMETYFVAPFTG